MDVMRGWQSQQCVELLLNYNYGNVENFFKECKKMMVKTRTKP